MGQPVVHFEIIGNDPPGLRSYYGDLFGWEYDTGGPVSSEVSQPGNYGFVAAPPGDGTGDGTGDGAGIPGGVGGGPGYGSHVIFYVGVSDVEATLQRAESLGGTRRMGPDRAPGTGLVIGHFADPEGNVIGLASTA